MSHDARARLSDLRRTFHRHPEPGWREFRTTARVVEELERIGVDEIAVGREALATDARMAVPDDDEISRGSTALVGPGSATTSSNALRVATRASSRRSHRARAVYRAARRSRRDLDSRIGGTRPPAGGGGFRSEHDGYMHACGHDAHLAIALQDARGGQTERVRGNAQGALPAGRGDFRGRQGDGREATSTASITCLRSTSASITQQVRSSPAWRARWRWHTLTATFEGASAHAGKAPNEGANAMQAAAVAIQNAYGIARHRDGRHG